MSSFNTYYVQKVFTTVPEKRSVKCLLLFLWLFLVLQEGAHVSMLSRPSLTLEDSNISGNLSSHICTSTHHGPL